MAMPIRGEVPDRPAVTVSAAERERIGRDAEDWAQEAEVRALVARLDALRPCGCGCRHVQRPAAAAVAPSPNRERA
jgi:hypothetical protein